MKYNLYLKNLPAMKSKVYWYYKPGIKKWLQCDRNSIEGEGWRLGSSKNTSNLNHSNFFTSLTAFCKLL